MDKENLLEFPLYWSVYLYTFLMVCAPTIPHSQPNDVWHDMW